jgi:hypothetical protein
MKNIILSIVITLLVVAVAFFVWQYFSGPKQSSTIETSGNQPPAANVPAPQAPSSQSQVTGQLSEQPNQAKYDEYFNSAKLGKLSQGQTFDPFKVVETNIFSLTDQFCTMLDIKKTIASGSLALAIYNTETKTDVNPKGVFPMEIKSGGSVGCEKLDQSVGKYEYKIYIDDVLAIVLPFEVR